MNRTASRLPLCVAVLTSLLLSSCFSKQNSAPGPISQELIAGLHHWEIPSKDPDRIILTFNGDPATSRAVTWRTDTTVTKAVAQIAVATVNSGFTKDAQNVEASSEPFDLGIYKGNASLKSTLPLCKF